MGFNPFTWNNTQPSASQLISDGQTTILNNVQFLGSTTGRATPGFIQFPNGIIIQWGRQSITPVAYPPVAGTFTQIVTFPTPFPNALFNVQFSEIRDDVVSLKQIVIKQTADVPNGIPAPTVTSFALYFSSSTIGPVYWLAIGY